MTNSKSCEILSSSLMCIMFEHGAIGDDILRICDGLAKVQIVRLNNSIEMQSAYIPGLYILDMRHTDFVEFEMFPVILAANPEMRVVVIVSQIEVNSVIKLFRAGVSDLFVELPSNREFQRRLRAIDRELMAATETARRTLAARAKIDSLSPRERDVLYGLIQGHKNKIVAIELAVSVRTVEMFRARMLQKLGLKSVADAIRLSLAANIDWPDWSDQRQISS
jgi:two-component system response regulator FixJ